MLPVLPQVLETHIRKPISVDYAEDIQTAKTDSKKLREHGSLICALEGCHEPLIFSQSLMASCLVRVAEKKHAKWKLEGEELQSFAERVAKRIRCMCNHYITARRRPNRPRWVGEIEAMRSLGAPLAAIPIASSSESLIPTDELGRPIESTSRHPDNLPVEWDRRPTMKHPYLESVPGVSEQDEGYYTGWDAEVHNAWRCNGIEAEQKKEYATEIVYNREDHLPIFAVFGNRDHAFEIFQMTCKGYRTLLQHKEVRKSGAASASASEVPTAAAEGGATKCGSRCWWCRLWGADVLVL